jgi:hypothetical protein
MCESNPKSGQKDINRQFTEKETQIAIKHMEICSTPFLTHWIGKDQRL